MSEQVMQVQPGTVVETNDGRLGIVERVDWQPENAQASGVYLWLGPGEQPTLVAIDQIKSVRSTEEINRLATDANAILEREGVLRIPLAAERLRVDKQAVNLGEFIINKRVEEVEEVHHIPITHDELDIQRVPMNNLPLSAPLQPRTENGVLIVPVMQEVLVVQRQLVLIEELHVAKRYVTETQEIRDTVRRERVEVDNQVAATPEPQLANPVAPEPMTTAAPKSQFDDTNSVQTH